MRRLLISSAMCCALNVPLGAQDAPLSRRELVLGAWPTTLGIQWPLGDQWSVRPSAQMEFLYTTSAGFPSAEENYFSAWVEVAFLERISSQNSTATYRVYSIGTAYNSLARPDFRHVEAAVQYGVMEQLTDRIGLMAEVGVGINRSQFASGSFRAVNWRLAPRGEIGLTLRRRSRSAP